MGILQRQIIAQYAVRRSAAQVPPSSLATKSQFLRPSAMGRCWRSAAWWSSGSRPPVTEQFGPERSAMRDRFGVMHFFRFVIVLPKVPWSLDATPLACAKRENESAMRGCRGAQQCARLARIRGLIAAGKGPPVTRALLLLAPILALIFTIMPSSLSCADNAATTMIPAEPAFFLFGCGPRQKLLYRAGELLDARSGEVLKHWSVASASIRPAELTVTLTLTTSAQPVVISEDTQGVWLDEDGTRRSLTAAPVKLPDFLDGKRDVTTAALLRILHHEILLNVVDGKPLPNFMVYRTPWYRDGAMMAMVLARTGNLDLIKEWIMGLREPFDRNNGGQREPDNLGQALYLVSLVADATHPLVATVLKEAESFRSGDHLSGNSDFAAHPVYQTKWMKFGLRALGLPDAWNIPASEDNYSALFWMDYRDQHVGSAGYDSHGAQPYPYLGWASDHFYKKKPTLPAVGFPLSWEAKASQADYRGMSVIAPAYVNARLAAPHTWHAAEIFLYLSE